MANEANDKRPDIYDTLFKVSRGDTDLLEEETNNFVALVVKRTSAPSDGGSDSNRGNSGQAKAATN